LGECLRLSFAGKQGVVFAQRGIDFVIAGKRLFYANSKLFGGLHFRCVIVGESFGDELRGTMSDGTANIITQLMGLRQLPQTPRKYWGLGWRITRIGARAAARWTGHDGRFTRANALKNLVLNFFGRFVCFAQR
jgi:hypothetical protein